MKFQVLVATMNRTDFDLLNQMNITCDAIVINQCKNNEVFTLRRDGYVVNWYNVNDIGLSKSRNLALNLADADICLITDDDVVFVDDLKGRITDFYNKHDDVDIATFQINNFDRKTYMSEIEKIGYLKSMKVSSIEISFKVESIKNNEIVFNELFGAGSKYIMGEENIFLFEALKKGLNIFSVPTVIGTLSNSSTSTWFKGYNENFFISRGASFEAMTSRFSWVLIVQYALRKHRIYCNETSFLEAFKWMWNGRVEYRLKTKTKE